MDDLVRRKDLLEVMANCTSSWGQGLDKELQRDWALGVKIKDNFLNEIKKLEAVPQASEDKLTELLFANGMRVNARSLAKYILSNCALFATNHLPLEQKVRSECSSPEYCKGWNDAVKQMQSSRLQAIPCMVGDVVYAFGYEDGFTKIVPEKVEEIAFTQDGVEVGTDKWCYSAADFGKRLFFTEAEAVDALEAHEKIVDALIAGAEQACEDANRERQQDKVGRNLDRDPFVWGEVDAAGCVEDEYEFY